jgi:hypothetical protein
MSDRPPEVGLRVIALDPGKQTGIATFGSLYTPPFQAWDAKYMDAMAWVHNALTFKFADLVVCESITINASTHKKSQDVKASIEQIGITRYLCHYYDTQLVLQTPAEAKGFTTDKKLRAIDWWTVGSDHARDATRHLVLALCERDSDFRQWVSRKI